MNRLIRIFRAFIEAARLTLRGEKPPLSPRAALEAWFDKTVALTDAVFAAADAAGLDREARRRRVIAAEGRRTNMETILAAIRFHAAEEYPHLSKQTGETVLGAIYGTNFNDRFLVSRLLDTVEEGAVRAAITALSAHLEAVPSTSPANT